MRSDHSIQQPSYRSHWLHSRCAVINLRTLLRHGLTRRDGAWILA